MVKTGRVIAPAGYPPHGLGVALGSLVTCNVVRIPLGGSRSCRVAGASRTARPSPAHRATGPFARCPRGAESISGTSRMWREPRRGVPPTWMMWYPNGDSTASGTPRPGLKRQCYRSLRHHHPLWYQLSGTTLIFDRAAEPARPVAKLAPRRSSRHLMGSPGLGPGPGLGGRRGRGSNHHLGPGSLDGGG